jgi:hypothetical protein
MKSAALTTVVMLTLSASAFAQEARKETLNERDYRDHYDGLTVGLRNTLPGGEAFDSVRWGDLVSGGIGVELQYGYLWRASSWVYGGWYAGLDVDSFGGRTSTQGGLEIRTDRLNTANVVFGGRLRQNFNGFHVDENVGLGAVIYMKQEFAVRSLGIDNLELIKSSVNYLVNFGVRVGAPLSKNTELNLGLAYQVNGAPDEGKDFTGKFKSMGNVIVGLSLDFGF